MRRNTTVAIAATVLALLHQTAEAAGNIDVTLQGGILFINGDREGNDILLGAYQGYLLVGGCDYNNYYGRYYPVPSSWNGSQTTVNDSLIPIQFTPAETAAITDIVVLGWGGDERIAVLGDFHTIGISPNLWMDTGSGQDNIRIHETTSLPGELYIDSGLDDDTINLNALDLNTVDGSTNIQSGNGDDSIFLSGLNLNGATSIQTGQGKDWVLLFHDVTCNGDLSIDMGIHDDLLTLGEAIEVKGNLTLQLGQGDDLLSPFNELVTTFVDGDALLDGGPGYDPLPDTSFILSDSLTVIGFESP